MIVASLAGALCAWLGASRATRGVLDIGPTDGAFVDGFRDLERDGDTYFRWTSGPSSVVELPMRWCGDGEVRLRVRRHFTEPAALTVSVNERTIGQTEVAGGGSEAYSVVSLPITKATCGSQSNVLLETLTSNSRPLGVVVDWIEIRARSGFNPSTAFLVRCAAIVALTAFGLLFSGASVRATAVACALLSIGAGWATSVDPFSAVRIVGAGLPALGVTLLVLAIARTLAPMAASPAFGMVAAAALAGVLLRLSFLDLGAFYPDYRVHALVTETLNRLGLSRFMDQLFEIQFARSLGLQQINGNWYSFPYPPGAYVLVAGFASLFGLTPLDAAISAAACAGGALAPIAFLIARRIGIAEATAVASTWIVISQPLLIRRAGLGYFPGVIGQAFDALAFLYLIRILADRPGSARSYLAFGVATFLSFLIYTQSIANFGILIASLLVLSFLTRSPDRRPVLALGGVAALALLLAIGAFYGKYLPVLESVERGERQPASIVLDRLDDARRVALTRSGSGGESAEELNDPFAGSDVNPVRGFMRLGVRLWLFWGAFGLFLPVGFGLLWRRHSEWRGILAAWLSVALAVSFLAAGLPSPNGFQHLKDLEFTTPLLACCLAVVWSRAKSHWLRIAGAALWFAYAGGRFWSEWVSRQLPLVGL